MAEVLTADQPRGPGQSRIPDILRRTVPWVRFMSVLLFISCGVMMIGGLLFTIAMAVGLASASDRPGGAVPAVAAGLAYCGMGLINLIPAVFLMRFAGRAKAYVAAQTTDHLEQALDAQRSYWKFMGIFMIVGFVGAICVFVIAAIAGFMFYRARAGG
jgi:ABC-type glycerol-3-phosphate transport system permease component